MQNFGPRHSSAAFFAAIVISATVLATCASAQTVNGVGNFHKVNEKVYRGAQPSTEGFANLAKLGIKTVVDLRETDGRTAVEKKTVEADGMRYINVPMLGMSAPANIDVQKVLALFNDASSGPVFVHCRRGADRTGTVVACYRISHDGWDNARALQEAKLDGMHWIEFAMQHFVMHYKAPTVAAAPAATAQ
jgi:tyrosine-protein phosphatase SIW14